MSIANNPFKDTLHKKKQTTFVFCPTTQTTPYTPPTFLAPDLKRLFPKMVGFPPNHPFWSGFPSFSPAILGYYHYFFGNPSNHQVILAILVLPAWKWYILPGLHSPPQSTTSSAVASTMGSSIGVHAGGGEFRGGKRGWLFGKGVISLCLKCFFFFFPTNFCGSDDSECVWGFEMFFFSPIFFWKWGFRMCFGSDFSKNKIGNSHHGPATTIPVP